MAMLDVLSIDRSRMERFSWPSNCWLTRHQRSAGGGLGEKILRGRDAGHHSNVAVSLLGSCTVADVAL